jgi:hypothetical protein
MRTLEEINRQIEGLQKERKSLPHHSMFGTDNWGAIDAIITILRGEKTHADFELEEDYEIESAAYNAEDWLNGNSDDDLFSGEE